MNNPKCNVCGDKTKKNGVTKTGKQRWRCISCGASFVRHIDNSAKLLGLFLRWLLSKETQSQMGYSRATFKRLTSKFWKIWPVAPYTGEIHDVVFLDGIWIGRVVVLIASTRKHVITWHLARSESTESWAALMAKIPQPKLVVCDGSNGFTKALRAV